MTAPSQAAASGAESSVKVTSARQRPGLVTAGWSWPTGSFVVSSNARLRPWPIMPSVRLNRRRQRLARDRPGVGPQQLVDVLHDHQAPQRGALHPAPLQQHVEEVLGLAEELLGVDDEQRLAPVAPGPGQGADGGGLAGAGRPVPQQQAALPGGALPQHQLAQRAGHVTCVVGHDVVPGRRLDRAGHRPGAPARVVPELDGTIPACSSTAPARARTSAAARSATSALAATIHTIAPSVGRNSTSASQSSAPPPPEVVRPATAAARPSGPSGRGGRPGRRAWRRRSGPHPAG